MDKLEILKTKSQIENLKRVASSLDSADSMYAALVAQAKKLEKEVVAAEKTIHL